MDINQGSKRLAESPNILIERGELAPVKVCLPPANMDRVTWVETLPGDRYRWGASFRGQTTTGRAHNKEAAQAAADDEIARLRATYYAQKPKVLEVDREDLVELIEALHGAIAAAKYLEPEKFDDPEHEKEWADSLESWETTRDRINKKYGT